MLIHNDIEKLPAGIIKACAGIVESVAHEPWRSFILEAEKVIGRNYADNPAAQRTRAALVEAVKLNLVNRKDNSYERLARRYSLPIDYKAFHREKIRFCRRLAELCGWLR